MRNIRQVNSNVATVMPEMGFDDEPISPVSREETVTNKNPKTTIRIAPSRFMCNVRAARIAAITITTPVATNFIERSRSVLSTAE